MIDLHEISTRFIHNAAAIAGLVAGIGPDEARRRPGEAWPPIDPEGLVTARGER